MAAPTCSQMAWSAHLAATSAVPALHMHVRQWAPHLLLPVIKAACDAAGTALNAPKGGPLSPAPGSRCALPACAAALLWPLAAACGAAAPPTKLSPSNRLASAQGQPQCGFTTRFVCVEFALP